MKLDLKMGQVPFVSGEMGVDPVSEAENNICQ